MLKNYLKTAFRSMYRDKWYSIINIGGLSIGMCVAILLAIFIKHELSFDKFHDDYQRIYRLHNHTQREGLEEQRLPMTLYKTGENILEQAPEVETLVRIFRMHTGNVTIDGNTIEGDNIFYTDSSFFKMFNYPIAKGEKINPILEPNKIAITQKIAEKWFGEDNPIGKSVIINSLDYDTTAKTFYQKKQVLNVSAVLKNIPNNSHLRFNIITSFQTASREFISTQGQDFFTYVKLYNPISQSVYEKLDGINGETLEWGLGAYGVNKESVNTDIMPLHKIHLNANYHYDIAITSNKTFVATLGVVAILILAIASINFVNLTTARTSNRLEEVGIRKALGSSKFQLSILFIGESILASISALVFAFVFAELLINPFNNLLGTSLSIYYIKDVGLWGAAILLSMIIGVIGGIYPLLTISKFNTNSILRGLTESGKSRSLVRSILVIFQFGMATLLIFGLLVINMQLRYMNKKDLGFDKNNVVVFTGITKDISNSYKSLRSDILSNPKVIEVSAAQSLPGGGLSGMNLYLEGNDPSTAFNIRENRVQDNYLETLKMNIAEGRTFIPDAKSDNDSYIINETAARMLGLESPIGARVVMWRRPGVIIGVVKDYHFTSLKTNIEPLIISRYNSRIYNLTIRIRKENKEETISQIIEIIKKHEPNYIPSNFYLDDFLAKQYGAERRTYKLILSASILALILSMVGLYALSAYSLARRTKELGIRKILGASVKSLYELLIIDSTKWVLIANVIALPVGWYFAKGWLNDFAYRINIEPSIFIVAALSAYTIALLTVLWQIVKAARANPAEALRYE